jgi:hypothetical protein
MPRETWEMGRGTYGKEFAEYVDNLYQDKDS